MKASALLLPAVAILATAGLVLLVARLGPDDPRARRSSGTPPDGETLTARARPAPPPLPPPVEASSPARPAGAAPAPAPRTRTALDPATGAEARLEAATAAGDAAALRRLWKEDRSLVRFEALRRLLALEGRGALPALVDDLLTEDDPRALGLLGTALGASGEAAEAARLAAAIPSLESAAARLAAASAAVEIAARDPAAADARAAALPALEDLARGSALLAARAAPSLAQGGEAGLLALERIALDRSVDDRSRLTAAEAVLRADAARGLAMLRMVAETASNEDVRRMAEQSLAGAEGGR